MAKFHVAEVLARKRDFTVRDYLSITPHKFEADLFHLRGGLEKAEVSNRKHSDHKRPYRNIHADPPSTAPLGSQPT